MMHGCDFKINAVVVAQWISRQLRNYSLWFKSQHKSYPGKFIGDRIKTQHCSSAAVAALNRQCYWYHKK